MRRPARSTGRATHLHKGDRAIAPVWHGDSWKCVIFQGAMALPPLVKSEALVAEAIPAAFWMTMGLKPSSYTQLQFSLYINGLCGVRCERLMFRDD
jgi:hypothetical protein